MNQLEPMEPKQPELRRRTIDGMRFSATKLDPNARYLIALDDDAYAVSLEDVESIKAAFTSEGIRVVVITGDPKVYELQASS